MCKKVLSCLFLLTFIPADISAPVPENSVVVRNVDGYAKFINNSLYGDPGCPVLPSKSYSFLVPPDADLSTVSFEILGITEKYVDGNFKIHPSRPPKSINGPVWPDSRNIVNGRNSTIYSRNAFFPDNYIQDITVSQMRCYKIVKVRVYFSKFNPATGRIKSITNGKLVLNITRKPGEVETRHAIPGKFKKLASKLADNYRDMASLYNEAFSFTLNGRMARIINIKDIEHFLM